MTLHRCSALLAIGIASALAPSAAAAKSGEPREFDWCAPVVSDPLRRWSTNNVCSQPYALDDLAAGAEVVMMEGPELPDTVVGAAEGTGDPCRDEPSRAGHARYLQALRAKAQGQGRSVFATVKTRLELVGPRLAERPGFEPGFLLRTQRPWSEVTGFFAEDSSADCAQGGCRLAEPGAPSSRAASQAETLATLWARIDAGGAPGASRSVVYYLSRGSPGQRVHRVTNAVANLGDPAYRAWRVREARRAIELGGYDAVMLNQKFNQYRPPPSRPPTHWIASPTAPDVTRLNRLGDTLWSAPPHGYGYAEYVAGWRALASDLRRAGVPYAVSISPAPWLGQRYDDPSSPADENALIRDAAKGARLVLLDWPKRKRGREFAAVQAELEKAGARVLPVDGSCGQPGARLGGPAPAAATPREPR